MAPGCGTTSSSTGISYISYNMPFPATSKHTQRDHDADHGSGGKSWPGGGRRIGAASRVEDPSVSNYQTGYTYDALDDLTLVAQGTQTRVFNYDSLKRLTNSYSRKWTSGTLFTA